MPKSRLDATLQLFRRFPFRAFLAVFLLVFLAVVLAVLLDPAAVFLAGFAADFLTALFARVFLRGLAARLEAARFRRGARAAAIGGTIMGSETRPSAASGM
jgi:hypothetical protein